MQKVCIIIPCYNEEKRLPAGEFRDFITNNTDFAFCFVNDGSSDNTSKLLIELQALDKSRIQVLELKKNSGKAEAVRQGILFSLAQNSFEYVGYFDADFATPLWELPNLLDAFNQHPKSIMVAGSRIKRMGSVIVRSAKRHYLGRVFSTIASLLLRLHVYDTQCGAKILTAPLAEIVFSEHFISRWLFDIELFARISAHTGMDKIAESIYEVPLSCWIEKGGSNIKLSYFIMVPLELFIISRKYRLRLHSKFLQ
jgi:dolichyl-phosphate beta-glucosyltransferase